MPGNVKWGEGISSWRLGIPCNNSKDSGCNPGTASRGLKSQEPGRAPRWGCRRGCLGHPMTQEPRPHPPCPGLEPHVPGCNLYPGCAPSGKFAGGSQPSPEEPNTLKPSSHPPCGPCEVPLSLRMAQRVGGSQREPQLWWHFHKWGQVR